MADNRPPHSVEAEQGVLGALLMDNAAFDRLSDLLTPEHFYDGQHRAIYATVARLIVANKPADVITVYEAGGHDASYLNDLCGSVPSTGAARRYAGIVVERWKERQAMRVGADLADDMRSGVLDAEAFAERIDAAVSALLQLRQSADGERKPQRVHDLATRFVDHVSALYEGKATVTATGLRDWDKLTGGGIRPGELWVIGARPSMGKTALTGTLVRNMSRQGAALFCSQEDSDMALVARHVAALGRVNLADLRNPRAAPEAMWTGLTDGVDALVNLPLWIDTQASLSLPDVRRKIAQVKREDPSLRVCGVDYLQLMVGEGANRNIELGRIANGLKAAAKDYGVGLILLSQMTREADKRTGPPVMSDLRDSGDIEGAADLIGLLHRECRRTPDWDKHHAELHVVKHKSGNTDTVHLSFDGAFQRFTDWEGPPPSRSKVRRSAGGGGLD